jgi:hypothetical protein
MNIKNIVNTFSFVAFILLFSNVSSAVTVNGAGSTFEISIGDGFDGAEGDSREAVFVAAAQFWADILVSPVVIEIDAEFLSTLSCSSNSATLGSAGPASSYLTTGAPAIGLQNNVMYPTALLNAHNGSDRFPGSADISARFNDRLGDSDCLAARSWYYALDGNSPSNQIDLYDVVRHELGHGLGILSLVNDDGTTQGNIDIFTTFLHDQSTGKDWSDMSDAERNTSVTNAGNVVWSGSEVNALAGELTAGVNSGKVRMYAPSTYASGSSISHFDTALTPNELMEPEYNSSSATTHSTALLKDIGWSVFVQGNNVPNITGQTVLSTNEDTSLTLTLDDLIVTDSDNSFPADFTLTVNSGSNYSVSGQTITPINDYVGSLTVPVTVNDGADTSNIFNVAVTVNSINDDPVISGTSATIVGEGSNYSFTPTASDVDAGDTKTFSIINKPSWASFSASTGTLSGTPNNSNVGIYANIIITVTDSAGASDSLAAYTITVFNVNNSPVISGAPVTTLAEETFYSFTPTVNDIDVGDTKTFSIINKPSWASFSTLTGTLNGTPSNNDAGTYANIVITVTDNAAVSDSLAAFSIIVTQSNTNHAPTVTDQTLNIDEDNDLTITLNAEDVDNDDLTYSIETEPLHGTLVQSSNTIWVYSPDANYSGTDSFSYKATDAELSSVNASVNITVNSINDTPTAQDDVFTLLYAASGRYELNVLSNDSDIDEDTLSIINASASTGTVSIDDGQLVFQISGVVTDDVELSYTISDGSAVNGSSGANVILTFTDNIEALLPVITLPDDIELNATALFTKVDLGTATASNYKGEVIPVSLVNTNTQFLSGSHIVYWQAEDTEGLKQTASQRVIIHPLINITNDSQGIEGENYKVAVHLNGESPSYPVNVNYTVSGDADGSDHDLVSGELVIESGVVGYIEFNTFTDNITEANETIVITLESTVNLGAQSVFTFTLTENNIAPQVSLTVSQNSEQRTLIDKTSGDVIITSEVFDENNDDNHTYTWESIGTELIDTDNNNTSFTFNPENVVLGQQIITLTVTDNNSNPLSSQAFAYFEIVETLPTLTNGDQDGDSIADNVEGFGDTDGDGIADYLDNNDSCNVQPQVVGEYSQYFIETEPGYCVFKGVNSINNASGSLLLNVEEVPTDEDAENIGGIFDFILTGLPVAGNSISLVIPQRSPVPNNAVYRKVNSDGVWSNFIVDENNYYSSTAGEEGFCPAPNDASWTIGLTEGHWCVQLTVEDGGSNDDDGLANYQIVDPGGVSVWTNTNVAPIAVDDVFTTTQNTTVTIDVLANDTDSDGDNLSITTATADFGNVTIVDQQLRYQPAVDYAGLATINYSVDDSNGGTDNAIVLVTVVEVNTPPTAVDDTANTDDTTPITINVLSNDTDIDNDDLTLTLANAQQGTVVINNNMLAYTPRSNFAGTDIVTYTVSDGAGGESQGEVSVSVTLTATVETPTTPTTTSDGGGGSVGILLLFMLASLVRIKSKVISK